MDRTSGRRMRLFFALPLPGRIRRALSALRTDLGGARWVPEAQLHLTLRFLGEVDDAAAARVIERVHAERRDAPWPAVRMAMRGVGVFGGARPRVLWAAVDPPEPARRIAESLERAVVAAGLPAERRPFAAHVTLARLRRPNGDALRAFLARESAFATDAFDVSDALLYRSTLSNTGAIHEPVERFPL